jgi:superfamily I DNA/RNA helicase
MPPDVQRELDEAVERVLASKSRKKLVVAGPGAGKTFLFKKLLAGAPGGADQRLVLTFINNLKTDLERSLGDAAQVFTLHGYCQHLLRRHAGLRSGLTADFRCFPGLVSLIKRDWGWLQGSPAPEFVKLMRDVNCSADQEAFYLERANYYDAVDFDDSVYRVQACFGEDVTLVPPYELVLIDEFQDFNRMEASVIDRLADKNAIVVAGDDDQALYSQLRAASWDHIRERYEGGDYEIFELPFCLRCPEVIVGAVADVLAQARADECLEGRIEKPYRYFEPVKGEDSRRFPNIELIETTVQRSNANYFGKFIEKCIRAISEEDLKSAAEKHEPAALIIGSNPYRRQVEQYLIEVGLLTTAKDPGPSDRQQALEILNEDPQSNLAWRIVLAEDDEVLAKKLVIEAAKRGVALFELVPEKVRAAILAEAKAWAAEHAATDAEQDEEPETPAVKVTSYEGSKGLSAQYVFLVGLQSGALPQNAAEIKDIEICRFLVGMTRTKRQCSFLVTGRFGNDFKQPSEFLSWIKPARFTKTKVDAAYWKK